MQPTLVASGPWYAVTGKVNQNVDPRPSSDVTPIPPPSSLASSRDIERPRPVPPNRRVVELSACWKGTNKDAQWLFESPMPVSLRTASQLAVRAILNDDILYDELDGNHFRIRCRSVRIHGHCALHGTSIGKLDRVLTRTKVNIQHPWPRTRFTPIRFIRTKRRSVSFVRVESTVWVTLTDAGIVGVDPLRRNG